MSNTNEPKVGDEALICRVRQGYLRAYGVEIKPTKIARVTKSRIYVEDTNHKTDKQREFNRDDMRERDGSLSIYARPELVTDPAKMADLRAKETARAARKALENETMSTFSELEARFEHRHQVERRSDEILRIFLNSAKALVDELKAQEMKEYTDAGIKRGS